MFQNMFITFWKVIYLTLALVIAFALAFYMTFAAPGPTFAVSFDMFIANSELVSSEVS